MNNNRSTPLLMKRYALKLPLDEDVIWRLDVLPVLGPLPKNTEDIWQYSITEMLNNAIDHSGGSSVTVIAGKINGSTEIAVEDDGMGIFRKIQQALGLLDERHALLELSKGKLTTDPEKHSGQGVFFTSRMLDSFKIVSGGVHFRHGSGDEVDWALEEERPRPGTAVFMRLADHSSRTLKEIFDQYSSGGNYDFTRTVVPVRLAQYGDERLVSRSQAKRVLARVDLFKTVVLDFADVSAIGQAFADEIFRVFAKSHPQIEVHSINESRDIASLIEAARRE